ncbi:NDR1/HIN1-like protein 10 [Trifolium pratense]|uniref:NDR1/HIN1-like protein 10 n=1 Tax=Trifolium pratense TaxID=57577 RepID=UPI001E695008|nr:NDR1/HIN1-like protein 10 [Trifolium pratense]
MTYKSLEEAVSCTQTDQIEEASCTETQQSSKIEEVCGAILLLLVLVLFIGIPNIVTFNSEPPRTKFTIADASIVHFNLASNNTLYYNFRVTIAAKNFQNYIKSYDKATAIASYKDNQLTSVKMAPFKLSSKNTVRLEPIVFEGNNVMILEPQQLAKYNKETQLEIYNLDVDLDLDCYKVYIHCPSLRVPLISNGKVAPTFNSTTCSYKDDRW